MGIGPVFPIGAADLKAWWYLSESCLAIIHLIDEQRGSKHVDFFIRLLTSLGLNICSIQWRILSAGVNGTQPKYDWVIDAEGEQFGN